MLKGLSIAVFAVLAAAPSAPFGSENARTTAPDRAIADGPECTHVIPDKQRTAAKLLSRAITAAQKKEWEKATRLFGQARAAAEEACAPDIQASALLSLGGIAIETGDWDRAKDMLMRALALFRKIGDRDGEGRVYINLAIVAQKNGRRDEAEEHYRQAQPLLKDPKERAVNLGNRANLLLDQGRLDEAESLFIRQLKLSRHYTVGKGRAHHGLCRIAFMRGQYETANEACKKALAVFRQRRDRWRQAEVLFVLGETALLQNDLKAAEAYLNDALILYRKQGNLNREAGTLNLLGAIARQRKDHKRAETLHKRADALFRETGHRRGRAAALGSLGLVAMDRGAFAEAADYLRRSLSIADEIGMDEPAVAGAELSLGDALHHLQKTKEACEYWKRGRDRLQRLGQKQHIPAVESTMAESGCGL